jgi:hypothetical protein
MLVDPQSFLSFSLFPPSTSSSLSFSLFKHICVRASYVGASVMPATSFLKDIGRTFKETGGFRTNVSPQVEMNQVWSTLYLTVRPTQQDLPSN